MHRYHSKGPNCTGQTSGSCNGDIIQQPVDLQALSAGYQSFASEFIGNATSEPAPFLFYAALTHMHVPQ